MLCRVNVLKKLKGSRKIPRLVSCVSNTTIWLYQNESPIPKYASTFFSGQLSYKTTLSDCMSGIYYYCFGRLLQRQLSRFTRWNTVTSFRTVVKSNKDLKGTEIFIQRYFRKKLVWKISQYLPEKDCDEALSYLICSL